MPIKRLNIPIRLNDLFKVIRFFNSREEELHVSYQDLKNQLQTDLTVTAGSSTLDGLSDVVITSVANGQVLVYDSATSQWINQTAGPATTLDGLTDVTIASVANGQFLVYNSGTSQWQNLTVSIPTTLNSLSDVNTPSPVDGHVLTWDSSPGEWVSLAPVYSSTFAGLSDVNVTGVAGDNTIRYDAASSKWVPTNITPATSLNGLTDVTLSSPANGQILIYNSTTSQWQNQNAPTGTGTVTSVAVSSGTGITATVSGNPNINPTINITNSAPDQTVVLNNGAGISVTGTYPNFTIANTGGGVSSVTATAPITSSGGSTPIISTSMATNKLIGRGTAGTGPMEEITLGTGLSMSGNTLNASGGGSSPLTTKGDLYTFSTVDARLGIGANATMLMADSTPATGNKWVALSGDATIDVTGAITLASNLKTGSCGVTFDGQGGTISNGKTAYVQVPYAGTITGWTLVANVAGNCTVTVFKNTYINYPPTSPANNIFGTQPALLGVNKLNATGLSVAVTAGDYIGFTISGVLTVSWVNLTLTINKT